jgi:hypothetical protein
MKYVLHWLDARMPEDVTSAPSQTSCGMHVRVAGGKTRSDQ